MEAGDSNSTKITKEIDRAAIADVICEFLEACFNLILYVRSVYPDGIFRKVQKYKVATMMSCHPELNKYINDILIGIKSLIEAGNVERVTMHINTKEDAPLEQYVFEIKLFDTSDSTENGMNEIEQHLRDVLLKINVCDSILEPLPIESTFAVTVQTKESVANKLLNSDHFEGFPWVQDDGSTQVASSLKKPSIVPLKSCSTTLFQLQCFVERIEINR